VTEAFDDVVKQYIDFVNQQVGAYMGALAGFAGHYARVERQVHRVNRPVRAEIDDAGRQVVVWASYEDPTKPNVIHNRIIRVEDYLAVNAPGGSNEQQHARAIVVFLFTYWEAEIRPRLAKARAFPSTKSAVTPWAISGSLGMSYSTLRASCVLTSKQS